MTCLCVFFLSIREGCLNQTPILSYPLSPSPPPHTSIPRNPHHTRRHGTAERNTCRQGETDDETKRRDARREQLHMHMHVHEKRNVEGRTKKRRKKEMNQQHTDVDQPAPNPSLGPCASYPPKIPWKHGRNNKNEHPTHAEKKKNSNERTRPGRNEKQQGSTWASEERKTWADVHVELSASPSGNWEMHWQRMRKEKPEPPWERGEETGNSRGHCSNERGMTWTDLFICTM